MERSDYIAEVESIGFAPCTELQWLLHNHLLTCAGPLRKCRLNPFKRGLKNSTPGLSELFSFPYWRDLLPSNYLMIPFLTLLNIPDIFYQWLSCFSMPLLNTSVSTDWSALGLPWPPYKPGSPLTLVYYIAPDSSGCVSYMPGEEKMWGIEFEGSEPGLSLVIQLFTEYLQKRFP